VEFSELATTLKRLPRKLTACPDPGLRFSQKNSTLHWVAIRFPLS